MKPWLVAAALFATGCSHMQLERTADKMVRLERGTESVVAGVVQFKDTTKADCIAQKLKTEAERAACVDKALKAVRASQPAVLTVKAALVSFWHLYGVLEAKLVNGERLSQHDVAELVARGATVVNAYAKLVESVKEVLP